MPSFSLPVGVLISADFSEDGEYLVTSTADGTVVWDASNGQRMSPPLRHRHKVRQAELLDGNRIVTASAEGTVRIWRFDPQAERVNRRRSKADVAAVELDQLVKETVDEIIPSSKTQM